MNEVKTPWKKKDYEHWAVVNTGTNQGAQWEFNETVANKARDLFNAHEKQNGRAEVYTVEYRK